VIREELTQRANAVHVATRQKRKAELEARGQAAAIRITKKLGASS